MNVTIRLYKRQDLDLIELYQNPNFSLSKAIRLALDAYVHNKSILIALPEVDKSISQSKPPDKIQFHIMLQEENDRENILFLKNIISGYRNVFLKQLVRCYLMGINIQYFLKFPINISPFDTQNYTIYYANKIVNRIANPSKSTKSPKTTNKDKSDSIREENISPKNNKKDNSENIIKINIRENETNNSTISEKNIDDNNQTDNIEEFDLFSSIDSMLANYPKT